MRVAKMLSALALVAALTGCTFNFDRAGCIFDRRCDPFPGTSYHPVTEWTSDQPAS